MTSIALISWPAEIEVVSTFTFENTAVAGSASRPAMDFRTASACARRVRLRAHGLWGLLDHRAACTQCPGTGPDEERARCSTITNTSCRASPRQLAEPWPGRLETHESPPQQSIHDSAIRLHVPRLKHPESTARERAGARGIRTILFGVGAFDVTTYGGVIVLVSVVVAVATYLPARRAANIDPQALLKRE